MNAMLEPRMVAKSIQVPAFASHGSPARADRIRASSQGAFMKCMDAAFEPIVAALLFGLCDFGRRDPRGDLAFVLAQPFTRRHYANRSRLAAMGPDNQQRQAVERFAMIGMERLHGSGIAVVNRS